MTKDSTEVAYETVAVGRALTTLDVNLDGLLDVFYGQSREEEGFSNGFPNLVLVQEGGTLVDRASMLLDPYVEEFTHAVASTDIDCDGDPDVFEVSEGNVRVNDGSGVLTMENDRLVGRPSEPGVGTPTWGAFCDYDRDGDADLFELEGDGWAVLYDNDGFGFLEAAPASSIPDPAVSFAGVGAADETWCKDVDRDGWPDIVVAAGPDEAEAGGPAHGRVILWHNNGDGTFSDETESRLPQSGLASAPYATTPYRMLVEDVNDDRWLDIVYSAGDTRGSTIFLNAGDGSFVEHSIGQGELSGWYFPMDADGDGMTDLFILGAERLSVVLNGG